MNKKFMYYKTTTCTTLQLRPWFMECLPAHQEDSNKFTQLASNFKLSMVRNGLKLFRKRLRRGSLLQRRCGCSLFLFQLHILRTLSNRNFGRWLDLMSLDECKPNFPYWRAQDQILKLLILSAWFNKFFSGYSKISRKSALHLDQHLVMQKEYSTLIVKFTTGEKCRT